MHARICGGPAGATWPAYPTFALTIQLVAAQFLLVTDQLSLARFLSPTVNELDLPLKILDDTWNLREDSMGERTDVRIHHADCYKVDPRKVEGFLRSRGLID